MSLPSVTQLLPALDFHCSREELERYAREGQEIHAIVKLYWDTQTRFPDMLEKLLTGHAWLNEFHAYLNTTLSWLGPVLQYEHRLESKKLGFTGKPDMVFSDAIIDLKRSFLNARYHALQLSGGYEILVEENKICKTQNHIILWYDNGFRSRNIYDARAKDIFIALLKKYQIDQAVDSYLKS